MLVPESEPLIYSAFNEADAGHIPIIDSYPPSSNTTTQFSPILHAQQASTSTSTLDPSTSSTGFAPTNGQNDRYIDIVHGGIWFADTDPSAQVANTLTKPDREDEERKRQWIPTRSSVEQRVSYFHRGSHYSTQASFNNRFHSHIGEKSTSNREGSSGGNPVEPFARLMHRDGGMTNYHSTAQNGDRQVASASRNSRKQRLSTGDNDGYVQHTFYYSSQYLNPISSLCTLFQQQIRARRKMPTKEVTTGPSSGPKGW
ncbi:hypothetical protein JR316_0011208 [Psilocybe cubensis]|uniref:Uncharacterized protein n=2 Tax=Psilocybe cubensis TaxID=181762 RepID=A0ACB8GJF0_PSICU|nr:hypothetical protein JR316_0011208 [Psilocybe cubensis]KAH9475651.1 hypothetical protein JR316_0011208 [Psilocybe cubensis]